MEESRDLLSLTVTALTDLLAVGLDASLPAWEADVRTWAVEHGAVDG